MNKRVSLRNSPLATRTDIYVLDPRVINVDHSKNPRNDYGDDGVDGDFTLLKESIKTDGLLQPVYIYIDKDGHIHLAHGFRRMRAITELLDEGVPIEKIKVFEVPFNEETILLQHFVMNNAKKLTDLELADTLVQLKALMGEENLAEISKRTGLTLARVESLIAFGEKASARLKRMVKNKQISIRNAKSLASTADGVKAQNEALDEALASANDNKITIKDLKILEANKPVVEPKPSQYGKLRSLIATIKGTDNEEIDANFAIRLENLLNDLESEPQISDKLILGKHFSVQTINA